MGLKIEVKYSYVCDSCDRESEPFGSQADAASEASISNWIITSWMMSGQPRQTVFCDRCIKRMAEHESKARLT